MRNRASSHEWRIGRRAALGAALAWPWIVRASAQTTAAATPVRPTLPPLLARPSNDRFAGKLIFTQLVTPDIAAAEQFYGRLFAWSFQHYQLGQTAYCVVSAGGRRIAGLLQRPLPPAGARQPAWLAFFSVADVDAATARATTAGASVLFAPTDVPDLGREAILADPQGALFALLASRSGDPPDTAPEAGTWIWASLLTTDPDRDAAFYQTVFDEDVFDLPGRAEAGHFLLASGDAARASINPLPARSPDARPAWIAFVGVDDADAAAARVAALGGGVLVPPRVDRHGGKVAIVADPEGAPFGLLEWSNGTAAP